MAKGQGVKIGLLCSRVRVEEKMLLAALRARRRPLTGSIRAS